MTCQGHRPKKARPKKAIGWRNDESFSFFVERCRFLQNPEEQNSEEIGDVG
jgi:hypothetical protein